MPKILSHQELVHSLFIQHSPEIRGFILSILPNMSRADDVLQETFLTVSRKSDGFRKGSNFIAWACTIARFKVLEDCKRHSNFVVALAPEVMEAVCAAEPPPDCDFKIARLDALKYCLNKLAPHTRRAVELRYTRAHRAPEIAQQLGWSTDSVYVVLSRARRTLLACIKDQLSESLES